MKQSEHWKILGLSKNSSKKTLTSRYRRLAAKHHPDKNGDSDAFIIIHEAYQQALKDIENRQGVIEVDIVSSPKELIALLGENIVLSYKDIVFEVFMPFETRVGDTIRIPNIVEKTDLLIRIKDRHE